VQDAETTPKSHFNQYQAIKSQAHLTNMT